jgi:hypothetical protein
MTAPSDHKRFAPDVPPVPHLVRTPLRKLTFGRFLWGGRIDDGGRLPRYAGLFLLGAAAIWAPITGYLQTAPERFTSEMSLILPGSGASASVNLSEIGQASSYANSPFASSSVSPTVTYKRLIGADRILGAAAGQMGMRQARFRRAARRADRSDRADPRADDGQFARGRAGPRRGTAVGVLLGTRRAARR